MSTILSSMEPWDLVAEGYAEVTMKLFQAYTDHALALTRLNEQSHILDLACGPGTLALTAADKVANVKALDFSSEMIDILNRTQKVDSIRNIDTHCGDGQSLPYVDNCFDAAFSMFGLMFFPDRMKGYKEILRTLKPGGETVISSWAPVSDSPVMQAVFGALKAMNPTIPDPQEEIESLENPDFFLREMVEAGYVDVQILASDKDMEIDSIETFWEDMVKGSAPIVMMKNSMPEDLWREKNKIALEYLYDTIGNTKTLSAKAWLAYGRKAR